MVHYVVAPRSIATSAGAARSSEGSDLAWCGFGDEVVWWQTGDSARMSPSLLESARTSGRTDEGDLYLVGQAGNAFVDHFPDARIALNRGRYLAVVLTAAELRDVERESGACFGVQPLPVDTQVVARAAAPVVRAEPAPEIAALTDTVSEDELVASMTRLADLGSRHSLSTQFTAAAEWARGRLESFGFQVSLSDVSVGGGTSLNVVADKPGTGANPRLVVATGHLDSVNQRGGPDAPAPGADDNASGAAGVLEIGRVLGGARSPHDLRLILFGGEEQGLHGSQQYVATLDESDRARLDAVVNMDMIATLNVPQPAVLLEGAPVSQQLMDDLAAAADTYTDLVVETSLNPFASDHVPFIDAGLPALLTIEGGDSANVNIHTADDTMDKIHPPLAVEILRMNVAVLATRLNPATRHIFGAFDGVSPQK